MFCWEKHDPPDCPCMIVFADGETVVPGNDGTAGAPTEVKSPTAVMLGFDSAAAALCWRLLRSDAGGGGAARECGGMVRIGIDSANLLAARSLSWRLGLDFGGENTTESSFMTDGTAVEADGVAADLTCISWQRICQAKTIS